MILNEQGKNEIRKEIEHQLKNVPEGQRVHLDKDLLEDLLFEKIIYKKEAGKFFKLPIWYGDFLSKIDLSEVSFEDVSWNLRRTLNNFCENENNVSKNVDEIMLEIYGINYESETEKDVYNKFIVHNAYVLDEDEKINYSNTNANIDFKKSWEFKTFKKFSIGFCNFSGTDLSNNDLDRNCSCIQFSDISNTKINVSNDVVELLESDLIFFTNLTELDFSKITIGASYASSLDNNFNKTNLKIENDYPKLINDVKSEQNIHIINILENEHKNFIKMINEGIFDGCYIDGKLISVGEQNKKIASEKLKEYEEFKKGIIDSISGSIKEQIGSVKK